MALIIGWSQAPEDATHYSPETLDWLPCWVKREDTSWYVWPTNGSGNRWIEDSDFEGSVPFLIPRPPTPSWNGEGLPPVGTLCEHFGTSNHTDWIEVEILGHGHVRHRDVAFFDYLIGTRDYTVSYSTANNFRPIRTPEQIAAEEREKAIGAMVAVSPLIDKGWSRKVCGALYDAGYRKTTD